MLPEITTARIKNIESLEMRRPRQFQVILLAVRDLPLSDKIGIVAVPRANLGEEVHQVAVGDNLVSGWSDKDACSQGGHQTNHQGIFADRWCLILGPQ